MGSEHFFLSILAFTCAIICAKWAMELGVSQLSQVLWGIAGLLLGPVALLTLYVRHLITRQKHTEPGGQWLPGKSVAVQHQPENAGL